MDNGGYAPDPADFVTWRALEFDSYWTSPAENSIGGRGVVGSGGGSRTNLLLSAIWMDGELGSGKKTIQRLTIVSPLPVASAPEIVPVGTGGDARLLGTISGWLSTKDYPSECIEVAFDIVVDSNCVGDLDGDLNIDLGDLAQLLAHYGTPSGATYEQGDLNGDGDGDVDLGDLAELLSVYGTSCP